jgi:hypothetical protein
MGFEKNKIKEERASGESEMCAGRDGEEDKIIKANLFIRSTKINTNRLIKSIFGYKKIEKKMIKTTSSGSYIFYIITYK